MILDDVKVIVDNFEDFIELPEGIEQLRQMVLRLAFSGKLVPQDSIEGTANQLYKEIQSKSISTAKKNLQLTLVSDDEAPFQLPGSWAWLRLGNVGKIVGGGTPSTSNKRFFADPSDKNSVPWLSPADMRKQASMYISHGKQNITQLGLNSSSATLMPKGSVIFSSRAPIGYVGIAANELTTNQGFKSIIPFDGIKPEYIYWYLKFRAPDINDRAPGTTFKEISGSAFAKEIISLPPTQEQARIVKRIIQIMEYLDALEIKKNEREKIRTSLTRSAMHSLGFGDADIALKNIEELVKTPSDLKELEKSILALAVSGKLVQQDRNEESVEAQLEICDKIRGQFSTSDHRADAKLQPLLSAEKRWEIPLTWKWRALADVVLFIDYRGKTPKKTSNGVRLVTAKNVKKGFISLSPEEFLSETDYDTWMTRGFPEVGDILFTTEAPMGNAAVIERSERFALAQRVICFHPYGAIDSKFLMLQILSEPFQLILNHEGTGMTAKGIKASKLKCLPIAIPPIAEQVRIVKKVEEMMELIRSLGLVLSKK